MSVLHNQKSPLCFPLSTLALISKAFLHCLPAEGSAQMKIMIWEEGIKNMLFTHRHENSLMERKHYYTYTLLNFRPIFRHGLMFSRSK